MRRLTRQFRAASPILLGVVATLLFLAPAARPDTVILHNGTSYTGKFDVAADSTITFTDGQGIQYNFPLRDVQSLVFADGNDIVTLRSGKVYSGQYTGANPIPFMDNQGVGYQFPSKDVESLVLTRTRPAPPPAPAGPAKVIPVGTEITIRTEDSISARDSGTGQLYSATISQDVLDAMNNVAIPAGTSAKLVIRDMGTGGAVHSADLVLDLFSISIGGKEYRVDSSDVNINNKRGVGANRRTAEYGGGGAAIGALFGGIFGGGKGAGIGAAAGAGSGLLTQIFTRGKQVQVPAETSLMFRLDQTLVLKPH